MLYKVGDVVVVRSDLQRETFYYMLPEEEYYNIATSEMVALAGMELPITDIVRGQYILGTNDGFDFLWTDEMFSGLANDDMFIPEDEFWLAFEDLLCG